MSSPALSLRVRATVAATLLGAVLSVLFAGAAIFITEDYEQVLVTEMLGSQAEDYSRALAADPSAPLPKAHRFSGFVRRRDGSGDVPPQLLPFGPGYHEDEGGLTPGMTLGVFDVPQGRLYFVIDIGDIEVLETHLDHYLAAIVLLGTALAAWLGWLLAGLSLAPVRRLAAAVDALPAAPRATALANAAAGDELGRLAGAIDRYQSRLVDADAEERRFFADASHELRTPIAVVRGVAELLVDDPDASGEQRRWLARLDRGMDELTLMLDVLLGLARSRARTVEAVDVRELVAGGLARLQGSDDGALEASIDVVGTWQAPRREAELVLLGVLRRLAGHRPAGRLVVGGSAHALEFAYAPAQCDAAATPTDNARGDGGVGMTLVTRLADVLGWRFEFGTGDAGLRTARIVAENVGNEKTPGP